MSRKDVRDDFEAMWRDQVSRRAFLRAAGFGVGAVGLGSVIAACSSDTDSGSPSGQPASSTTLDIAISADFQMFDPTTSTPSSVAINTLIYEALYRIDPYPPRTAITAELATSEPVEISPTSYRVPIREGVVFHDGSPLTAEDVVFTFQRFQNPETSPTFARFLALITDVSAVSDTEIQLELSAPTTLLTQRLALVRGILSKAAVEASPAALELQPVGSGPYRMESAASGQQATLAKFEDYSGNRELNFDELTVHIVADGNARVSGLRTEQFQVIEDVPESALAELESTEGVVAEPVPSAASTTLMFNCSVPPFDDVRVRRAALYAIDRDTITETCFFGHAEPAWQRSISAGIPGSIETETAYRYDPDEARRLLADAGVGAGDIAIDFLVSNQPYIDAQASIIEQNLADVGFRPTMIPGEGQGHVARVSEGSYHAWLLLTSVDIYGSPDAEFVLRWLYTGFTPEQFARWTDTTATEVITLLDQAVAAQDDTAKAQALGEVQNIIQDQVPLIPLHYKSQLTGWTDDLQDFRPLPSLGIGIDGARR